MGVIDSTNPSSKRVAPLEHGVHPEGHVARRIASSEWHPWSTGCILKGTSHEELQAASGTLGARGAS
jgi:hypothetical protein